MPGLVAFGRRWEIGSDDLVFPGLASVAIRLAWIIAISVVYQIHRADLSSCEGGDFLLSYLTGVLIILAIVIILELIIVYISMQGSVINTLPRRHIPLFLYFRVVFFIPEILWVILGTAWVFHRSNDCDPAVVKTVQGAVISSWIILIFVLIGIALVFDPLGKLHVKIDNSDLQSSEAEQLRHSTHMAAQRVWENRCKLLCCFAGCDENSQLAFTDVAELLTAFFKDIDVVPSDIAAGLALLQLEQASQEGCGQQAVLSTLTEQPRLPRPPTSPYTDIHNVAYYMKFAVASYGWPLYVYSNPLCGLCKLAPECTCCCTCCFTKTSSEDNCCECNTAALKNVTELRNTDIIYCSFHNKIYEIPFFVALDHSQLAVVISIRGSLSLKDGLTDMTAEHAPMEIDGADEILAHKGILQAAKFIKNRLENEHILEHAFRDAPDYKIVIVGHSLGAGAAALLSILLHNTWPGLTCYAYSPPGGLLSVEGCTYSKDFITSVVLGKDVIPRLSLQSLEDLKEKLQRVLRNNTQPKYQILLGGCWYAACGFPERIPAPSEDVESGQNISQPLLEERSATTRNRPRSYTDGQTEDSGLTRVPLFPPGQILHITEETERTWCSDPEYKVNWAGHDTLNGIPVSARMVLDHMPDVVMKSLTQIAQSTVLQAEATNHTGGMFSDDSGDDEEVPVIT